MTGTNIPEGHRRAFESLTRGDYNKLRDQSGIVADARLHDLRHSFKIHFDFKKLKSPIPHCFIIILSNRLQNVS